MLETLMLAWAWLGPLQYLTVTVALLVSIDLWKKLHQKSWTWVVSRTPWAEELNAAQELLHNLALALPQVLGSALAAIVFTGGDPKATLFSAIAGAAAPLLYHAKKLVDSLKKKPPEGGDQKPVGLKDPEPTRIRFTPPDPTPPDAAIKRWAHPAWRLGTALSVALALAACSPAALQVQRDTHHAVAEASMKTVLPSLRAAYRASGLVVIRAQNTEEARLAALQLHQLRWKPVWEAWDAYKFSMDTWQHAIDTNGNPLPAALVARDAYCKLVPLAGEWKVELPTLPLGACK